MGRRKDVAVAAVLLGLVVPVTAACTSRVQPAPQARSTSPARSATPPTAPATSATGAPGPSRTVTPTRSAASPPPTSSPASGRAEAVLRHMTQAQRVGQLFMVGTPATAASPATLADISRFHVGNVLLTGRSHGGATAAYRVVRAAQDRVTGASTAGVPLFVATDQEGGAVQVLSGPGIADMPDALTQGSWPLARLRSAARVWGRQLRASGVNLDLAPVMDTVPDAAAARRNPPIGAYAREFGYTPAVVAGHGTAFAQGLADAGVATAAKHFPGLGRVAANPDASSGVTDTVTRRGDPYLVPFRTATTAGVPFVMMSTAYYARLDARNPAAFSPFIIGSLLRGDLHFAGVVIADDLGNARQVARWTPGERAVRFVQAGGDMVLTVNPGLLPAMYDAVLTRATSDASFRAKVEAATLRVLRAKERQHLLGAGR